MPRSYSGRLSASDLSEGPGRFFDMPDASFLPRPVSHLTGPSSTSQCPQKRAERASHRRPPRLGGAQKGRVEMTTDSFINDVFAFIAFFINFVFFIWFGNTLTSIKRGIRCLVDASGRTRKQEKSFEQSVLESDHEAFLGSRPVALDRTAGSAFTSAPGQEPRFGIDNCSAR